MSLKRYEENENENSSEDMNKNAAEAENMTVEEITLDSTYTRLRSFQNMMNENHQKETSDIQQNVSNVIDNEFAELMTALSDEITKRVCDELTAVHRRYLIANRMDILEKISNKVSDEHRQTNSLLNKAVSEKMDEFRNKTYAQAKGIYKMLKEQVRSQRIFNVGIVLLMLSDLIVQLLF